MQKINVIDKRKGMQKTLLNSQLEERDIPSLFKISNGQNIRTKEEWEKLARPYWKNCLLQEEYGFFPKYVKPDITAKINPNYIDFAGKANWQEVSFTFKVDDKEHTVPTQLILPNNKKPLAVFVYLNFRPQIPDRYLPVEEIIDNGFGIFSVCYNDITTDNGDFTNGLAGLFKVGERKGSDCGKLIYWAYMASHMMDYLLTREEVSGVPIGIGGHSRLGKTALLVGAFDERFDFVCSNESGCSGASLSRGVCEGGEKVEFICNKFPYWFNQNYLKYSGNEQSMPFDQHCLISLIAPRAVCVGGALDDVWADNDNQFLSCYSASKIWDLYGEKGLISPDKLPELGDKFIDGKVGFFLREGTHFHSRTDWLAYMEFVKNVVVK